MKKRALFVGVNEYTDEQIRNLSCSIHDAHSMHDIFDEIGYETKCLENPSKGDVFHAVKEMTGGLKTGDQFLFYFAGHGVSDCGQHLLFCSDDMRDFLRFHYAGIPFNLLELETREGGFDRSFLLDACQSDFIADIRGGEKRDLVAINSMIPSAEVAPGSFYVLRSCSKSEYALEIKSRRHGLFTLAMMDVLRQFRRSGVELMFDDGLREKIEERMNNIALTEGMTARQTPESAGRGIRQVLFSGSAFQSPSSPPQPTDGKISSDDDSKPKSPPPKVLDSVVTREWPVSDWAVELNVDLPGCTQTKLSFTLFETLSRYLCLLQGLGRHDEEVEATAFGREAFRDSVWRLVAGHNKSAAVKCPILTKEDERTIANAGGMEELARQNGIWSIFKEVEAELNVLGGDLRSNCKSNPLARNALALVKEVSKSLKNQGEV